MVSFQRKKIFQKACLGEILRQARVAENWKVETVARLLGIGSRYVKALEAGNFSALPGEIYTKNFLKKYAALLQLDAVVLLEQFLEENKRRILFKPTANPSCFLARLKNTPNFLRQALALTVVAGLIIYLGIGLKGIFSPPPLFLETPPENWVSAAAHLIVKGKTSPETRVQINGQEIISNVKGLFEEEVNLAPGLNLIVIKAIKKYGQTTSLVRQVIFKEKVAIN